MPERSKGFDSSSNIFVCVGSNPTECRFLLGQQATDNLRSVLTLPVARYSVVD